MASSGHPKLYITPPDVARAKLNIERFEWAKQVFLKIRKGADGWTAMSNEQLRGLVPPLGSVFAYGLAGCPVCGANWPWWGKGVASLDKPGQATCPKCMKIFPDSDHPDSGEGWHDPKSGKTYYFVGCYNAFIAQQITLSALYELSTAYAITGEGKYSHAAAVLFDKLAELYPTSVVGSIDYPMQGNHGRLERPQYQVARVLVLLADYLDQLYDSPDFTAPSTYGKGAVREHIETNVIADGGKYCFDNAMSGHCGLNNGGADYVRGALAAGIILDKKEWIDCAITGPYCINNFLDNCLDREGQYYESSVGYSEHCLILYVDMAEMLYNLRTAEYPQGINLYNHPKLQKALFDAQIDISVFGHIPRYGDWTPDTDIIVSDSIHYYAFPEFLLARIDDHANRNYWAAARHFTDESDAEKAQTDIIAEYIQHWRLWHIDPVAQPKSKAEYKPRAILGGRGIGILRSGSGAKGQGALLRYGTAHNHAHLDDLNVNIFGLGRELTYDLGYVLGSAHTQVGWSNVTASHNLVVVNEKNQMLVPGGGGSPYFYIDRAPVRAVEASSEASYASEDVRTYRRTMAIVDVPGGSYIVDIFRVEGGTQHDLMWHFTGKLDQVTGVELDPVQEQGSLAGLDIDWGRKVGPAGYLIGCADKGDYWNPPPNNGYGFLHNIRRSKSIEPECHATWQLDPDSAVSLRLLPELGTELITAHAPGITPDFPPADYAILRRSGTALKSAFVSIVEPSEGAHPVVSARRLECAVEGTVGIEIKTTTSTDYILSSLAPEPVEFYTSDGKQISFNGRFGFIRVANGKVERGTLVGGTELKMGDYRLASEKAMYEGRIASVDYENAKVTLLPEGPLPNPPHTGEGISRESHIGEGISRVSDTGEGIVYFSREGYSHSSPYRVASVDGNVISLDGDLVLARGHIGNAKPAAPDAIANVVPLPRAIVVRGKPSGYFRGKLIRNDLTHAVSNIIDVDNDQRTVHVTDPGKFAAGDSFTIFDLQAGDSYCIPAIVEK